MTEMLACVTAMMCRRPLLLGALCVCLLPIPTLAAEPEIRREPYPAQSRGVEHTIRIIPEVCAYLHGRFTGDIASPYRYTASRSGKNCQPRAKLVDAAVARPSAQAGWILNDLIRIPDAVCPGQQAVIRIWRKPGNNKIPLDPLGKPRIYLQDAKRQAEAGKLAPLPEFAAVLVMEGDACR